MNLLNDVRIPTDYNWIWYAFAIIVLFYIAFAFTSTMILKYVNVETAPPIIVTPEKEIDETDGNDDGNAELPFTPCTFVFKDISYSVITPDKEELELLKNVTGFFEPGTMTALMGRYDL